MKKLTTAIVGLSLLVGSTLLAEDSFKSFYPTENIDTPSYLIDNNIGQASQTLAKSSIKDSTIMAFFPTEDIDTPNFLRSSNKGQSVTSKLAASSIKQCTFASFYPAENNDSPTTHISC